MADRDVTMNIGVSTSGQGDVRSMADEIRTLGESGGKAAPEFEKLGAELDALAAEADKLRGIKGSAEALDSFDRAAEATAATVADLSQRMRDSATAIAGFRAAEGEAAAAVRTANGALAAKRDELARLRVGADAAERGSVEFAQAERTLQVAIIDTRAALAEKRSLLQLAKAATRDAVAAENELAVAARKTATAVREQRASLETSRSSLEKNTTLVSGLARAFGPLTAAVSGYQTAVAAIKANVEIEATTRALTAVLGSSEKAAVSLAFLRKTAEENGIAFGDVASSYKSFAAAVINSGGDIGTVNTVFESTSRAIGALGLSSVDAQRAITALGQMASKGVVSQEELRQQLSEAIPGAAALMAKGLGMPLSAMNALIESGSLLSKDALPALARGFDSVYAGQGQVEGLAASWSRLGNTLTEIATNAGQGGGLSSGLATMLDGATSAIRAIANVANSVGQQIGITAAAIANFDWTRPRESIAQYEAAMADAAAAGVGFKSAADRAAAAAQGLGSASEFYAAKAKAATEATKAAAAATSAGQSTHIAAASAYDEVARAANQAAVTAKKVVEAKKSEGEAMIAVAQLSGNENLIRQSAAQAVQGQIVAQQTLLDHQQREATALRAKATMLGEVAAANKAADATELKAVEALKLKAEAAEAEVARTSQVVAGLKAEQQARELAVETLRDNAANVNALRQAYEAANKVAETTRNLVASGAVSQAQATEATTAASRALALYRDALDDATQKLKAKQALTDAEANLTVASLNVMKQQAATSQMVAEANGNETAALEAKIRQKEIDIQIQEARNRAASIEADLAMRQAENDRQEAAANGSLTETKRLEIEARLQNAKAKKLEAEAGIEAIKQMESEIDAIRRLGREKGTDRKATTDSGGSDRDGNNPTTGGGTPRTNNGGNNGPRTETYNNATPVDIAAKVVEKMNSGKLTAEDLEEAKAGVEQMRNAQTWLSEMSRTGSVDPAALNSTNAMLIASQQALDRVQSLIQQDERAKRTREQQTELEASRKAQTAKPEPTTSAPSSQTVNITIDGKTQAVRVASTDDARALEALMQQVVNDSRRLF